MPQPPIVATAPVDQIVAERLATFGRLVTAPDPKEETILDMIPDAVGMIVRGDPVISAKIIEAGKHLKVIARTGVGYNNVAVAAATAHGIPVVYTPGAGARAVAEAAMAMMLTLCKQVLYWNEQFKAGNWHSRYESRPGDVDGATLGIVGFGRIGQLLAEMAGPFNMTLLAHDPYVEPKQARQRKVRLVGLDELLGESQFISLHAMLTEETRHLIHRENLKRLQPGSYLVNLARGPLIESLDVLYEALGDGRLAAVGLDVFDPEPPDVNHPIFKLPNCLTAPHALASSQRAMQRIFESMCDDMIAIFNGRQPRFVVNPEVLG